MDKEKHTTVEALLLPEALVSLSLTFIENTVPAGFPSPAADYIEGRLDLNEFLIRRPAATFLVRFVGDSMSGAGIHDGDIGVVDRSIKPVPGCIVVAADRRGNVRQTAGPARRSHDPGVSQRTLSAYRIERRRVSGCMGRRHGQHSHPPPRVIHANAGPGGLQQLLRELRAGV